jgi:hypothetical protein
MTGNNFKALNLGGPKKDHSQRAFPKRFLALTSVTWPKLSPRPKSGGFFALPNLAILFQ